MAVFLGCNSLGFPVYIENTAREPIEIEVLRPADTTIDLSIKRILILIKPGLVTGVYITDGLRSFPSNFNFKDLPGTEFYKMADLLSVSPRFAVMEPTDAVKPPADKSYSWDEIDTICKKAGVDGCLLLDKQEVYMGVGREPSLETEEGFIGKGYVMILSTYEFYDTREKLSFSKQVKTGVGFQSSAEDIRDDFQSVSALESLVYDYASENG